MRGHVRQHNGLSVRLYPVYRPSVPGTGPYRSALLCLAVLTALLAQAVVLDPPQLRCASVNVAGDVTLTWTPIVDPGGDFQAYEVYHSNTAGGPFSLLYAINVLGQATQFHAGAGADAGPQFYYMTTVSNSVPSETSVPSDTVATLFLEVFQSTPLGSANLSWNAASLSATAADEFSVWLEYPIGTWTLLGAVDTAIFTYQHVVSVCEDSLTFRIGSMDASGCISFSNLEGDVFADATPPSMPVLTTVTVDTLTGLSIVDWDPSPEPDTDGYIIVWVTQSGGVIIDTVFGQNNTSYTWLASTPGLGPESFTVAAFDTCEVGTPPSPNTSATRAPHTTMHVEAEYDRCATSIALNWSPYVGWPVQTYQVLVQVDGGPWSILTNVPAGETSVEHAVVAGRAYCYVIKAVQGSGLPASLSNKVCLATDYPSVPAFNYLRTVTVSGEDRITVVDSVDMSASVRQYRFERSDNGGPYQVVGTVAGDLGPVISIEDTDVSPGDTGYRYRVVVEDSCGNGTVTSNIGGNIILRARPLLSGHNDLDWNGYADWGGTVGGYRVFRMIDEGPMALIGTAPADPWVYSDDVQDLTATNGRFCYYVQALETGNPSGVDATSKSNVVCAVQEELVYIPNAFVVGGANPVFGPVLAYADVTDYELTVINRWGQVIWTTDDRNEPWDGTVDGDRMPIGVYGYFCSFYNGAGRRVERRGTVTLLTAVE